MTCTHPSKEELMEAYQNGWKQGICSVIGLLKAFSDITNNKAEKKILKAAAKVVTQTFFKDEDYDAIWDECESL